MLLSAGAVALFAACASVAWGEELVIKVLSKPDECPRKSRNGDFLSVHYVGTLAADGKEFDSSRKGGQPFVFQIGKGQVIAGWDEGLLDMCVGEMRKLTIPASKGYGDRGAGASIPGGATLLFEVELIDIKDNAGSEEQPNIFKDVDADGDRKLTVQEISAYVLSQTGGKEMSDEEKESHHRLVAEIISHDDADKDGSISYEEFSGPKHEEL